MEPRAVQIPLHSVCKANVSKLVATWRSIQIRSSTNVACVVGTVRAAGWYLAHSIKSCKNISLLFLMEKSLFVLATLMFFCFSSHGYKDIVTIPSGATNINIKQQSHGSIPHDGNYLAVRRENGDYILNGNFSVSTVEQYIPVLGAVLKYSGSSTTLERLQSFRQLQEPITIQLLSTSGESIPPKVKYTFYIPKTMSFSKPKDKKIAGKLIHPFGVPQWVSGEWSECSKTCGSGWSRRNVECKDNAGFYSNHCNKDLRPSDIRPCADLPCPMWQIGPWSSCSQTCGHGERQRRMLCIDYTGKTVELENCDPAKMPQSVSEKCFYQECWGHYAGFQIIQRW